MWSCTSADKLTSMTILPAGCPSTVMSKNTFGLAIVWTVCTRGIVEIITESVDEN